MISLIIFVFVFVCIFGGYLEAKKQGKIKLCSNWTSNMEICKNCDGKNNCCKWYYEEKIGGAYELERI